MTNLRPPVAALVTITVSVTVAARSASGVPVSAFVAGRSGGATYMRILHDVAQAGRSDLVRLIEPSLDLDNGHVPLESELTSAPILSPDDYAPLDAPTYLPAQDAKEAKS